MHNILDIIKKSRSTFHLKGCLEMSMVRISNHKIDAACTKHITHLHTANIIGRQSTIEKLEKLIVKAKHNAETSINLNDADFVLIEKFL